MPTGSEDVSRPRDDLGALPLTDLTNFEIIQELQALGWEWKQLPPREKEADQLRSCRRWCARLVWGCGQAMFAYVPQDQSP